MFDRITDGFTSLFRKVSGKDTISESNVRDAMGDVKTALLEADVHHSIVDQFCEDVMSDAVGQEVTKSLEPGQEMIGIVYHRLIEFLGGVPRKAELTAASQAHSQDGLRAVTGAHYEGGHWLGSFAVYLLTDRGR